MSVITTHVLDVESGSPAAGIGVSLFVLSDDGRRCTELARGRTDADGRVNDLGPDLLDPARYRLRFDIESWSTAARGWHFFPEITLTFRITDSDRHYHLPVLLSSYSYTAYRGS